MESVACASNAKARQVGQTWSTNIQQLGSLVNKYPAAWELVQLLRDPEGDATTADDECCSDHDADDDDAELLKLWPECNVDALSLQLARKRTAAIAALQGKAVLLESSDDETAAKHAKLPEAASEAGVVEVHVHINCDSSPGSGDTPGWAAGDQ